jgi:NADH:ubiquinone oxidoreductase subunit K
MNKLIVVVFIVAALFFIVGLLGAINTNNYGAILISASILLASVFICLKIEKLKKK